MEMESGYITTNTRYVAEYWRRNLLMRMPRRSRVVKRQDGLRAVTPLKRATSKLISTVSTSKNSPCRTSWMLKSNNHDCHVSMQKIRCTLKCSHISSQDIIVIVLTQRIVTSIFCGIETYLLCIRTCACTRVLTILYTLSKLHEYGGKTKFGVKIKNKLKQNLIFFCD